MKRYLCTSVAILSLAAGASWAAKPAVATKPAPAASGGLAIQAVGTFDTAKPTSKLTITVAPDEFEPASVTVKAAKPLSGVSVKISDLSSGKSKLMAGQVAISMVDGDNLVTLSPAEMQKGETKRYWMTFNVPVHTAPGTYKGEVVAVAGSKPVAKLPVELTVLPMRLLKSSKQYGYTPQASSYGDATYDETLKKLSNYGFGLTSASVSTSDLQSAIKEIRDAGLGSAVPYFRPGIPMEDIAAANDIARAAGINRVYYAVDCASTDPAIIESALALAKDMQARRLKTFAVVADSAAYDALAANLDYTDLNMDLPYVQGLLSDAKRVGGRHDWVYWNITGDSKTNRLNGGFLLWKSGLDGAFIPCLTTEPASAEPLFTTIQGEALREGVDDTRYLTTLMSVLREVKDGIKAGEVKNSGVANQAVADTETYLAAVLAKPLNNMSNQDYQAIRGKLAQFAIKLQSTKK